MERFDLEKAIKITGLNIHAESADEGRNFDVACRMILSAIKEAQVYREIGTVEEFKALKDKPKCDECAGCTAWKCDCANIRETAITEFAEKLKNKLVLKYGNASVAQQYVAMQVTAWCAEIAKELKH